MSVSAIVYGLANAVPAVLRWIGQDKAADVVDIARKVTGIDSPEEAAARIKSDASARLAFQQELNRHAETLAAHDHEEQMLQIAQVNETMRSEAASEHWPTYSWRPYIGFAFGTGVLISVITTASCYIAVMIDPRNAPVLQHLPNMLASMAGVLALPLPVLGVASWFRGKMQADPNIPTINKG